MIESTIVQLIQRFYDPDVGRVLIDGKDLRTLNVSWLRSHIGLVSQEPVLFTGSIEDNIRFGKPDATFDEIQQAARMANAHDFIMALPEVIVVTLPLSSLTNCFSCRITRPSRVTNSVADRNNEVGSLSEASLFERLLILVAIARALISNPTILLLDEATSALGSFI